MKDFGKPCLRYCALRALKGLGLKFETEAKARDWIANKTADGLDISSGHYAQFAQLALTLGRERR